jgi:tetratricopeptide (TPR) repeat protein
MKLNKQIRIVVFLQIALLGAAQAQTNQLLNGEKREKFVQQALRLRQIENYAGALQQLDSILMHQTTDAPILLFKGDVLLQAKQYAAAVKVYTTLLSLGYERVVTQINLSYALFMNHQPAKALQHAATAWKEGRSNNNAIVNYFNALLWNMKTKQAAHFLQRQDSLLTPAQRLVLKARLYTTGGNYQQGLTFYDSLVQTYPDKYYAQEYAEVLLGKKEIAQSSEVMQRAKHLFSLTEYGAYEKKRNATQQQNAGTEMVYFKDVAKNIRLENNAWWQQGEGRRYRFRLAIGHTSITSALKEKTSTRFGHVRINERWSKAWSGETDVHLQTVKTANGNSFVALTGQQRINFQPHDRRMVGFFYSTEILNFTAELLGNNIRSNNLGYVTHLMLSGKTGFYSQGSMGLLSDKNRRGQFFGSLYHLFRTEPTCKGGVNFSYLHFVDNTGKNYFAPERFISTELFADYSTALPMLSKFYLQVQAAAGMQKADANNWDPTFRFQSELGLRLQHFEAAVKYQTSNVASSTGAGYRFNWFTARVSWRW